ncbi:TonB-dependent receptor [Sphingomonas jinjuensis]|uniref:TonB-dependent receptor n=1 Tax=Sphingomonas jinjuensis TaxID=535907 RepID=A0A840EYY0_9SPHN|nr:TonB-dependent receptor [Sphingomonas jinjuensis]MBB4152223.1 TonB-dependent receptor [Sphingomonas jinjuensis]
MMGGKLLTGVSMAALAVFAAMPAHAQDARSTQAVANPAGTPPQADEPAAPDVVVTGIRSSLASAQNIKRNADTIVDSIVAEDIGKLPDINVSEALQRITGIQVQRDVGEGAGRVQIRGLTGVETTINGRDAFTGVDRNFNLQNLPAELLSRLDVYKAPTANLIEGGIGGTIDIRTRRPFDFADSQIAGSARARYADLRDKWDPLVSLLMSDRWDTGIGEIGVLFSGAYQQRSYRQDFNITGAPLPRTDLIAGQTVNAPNGSYKVQVLGQRKRIGLNGAIQWQATPDLMFYVEGQYSRFITTQDQNGLLIQSNRNASQPTLRVPTAGSFTTFPGTNDLATGTYTNQPFTLLGVSRDLLDDNRTIAIGGEWNRDRLKVSFDASYDKSYSELDYRELDLLGTAPTYRQDLTTDATSFSLQGVDLLNPNSFTVGPLTQNVNISRGEQKAGRIDATYEIPGGFLRQIAVGARYADRSAIFSPIRFFQSPVNNSIGNVSQFLQQNPVNDFFQKDAPGVSFPQNFLIAGSDALRTNFDTLRTSLGITALPAVTPLGIFNITERTLAGYAMAKYEFNLGVPIDGNIGVRVIRFNGTLTGNTPVFETVTINGQVTRRQTGFAPINTRPDRTDVLPSFNLRARLTDELQLRLGASRVLTRPGFSQLTPSLTLVPAQGAGSGGNPNLAPFTADQVDASLEYYLSRTTSVSVAGFYKWVNAFTSTSVETNVDVGGILYNITRPVNSGKGYVRGFEVGGQTFLDFLPEGLNGFGVQANYTFVDSETPTLLAGAPLPLTNLSKHSYNVSALYEKYGISARVAYNWRSRFLEGVFAGATVAGATSIPPGPIYRKGYGWLDASLSYDIDKNVTVSFEGSNLLRTRRESYYTVPTRFNDQTIDDRQFLVGFRFRY